MEDTTKKMKVKVTDDNIVELRAALVVYNPSESTLVGSIDGKTSIE